jgi:transcriptional regulator with XRE-family HTH domain
MLDCGKVGALLYRLRKEKGMTQWQVANQLNISDKTVSKWERGLGCPDVSLLGTILCRSTRARRRSRPMARV